MANRFMHCLQYSPTSMLELSQCIKDYSFVGPTLIFPVI